MDFMKVLDQTVRDIKREVNLKVLKVPEIEQKVLDATSDEPWGPHGSVLSELAEATKKFTESQMVMNVLWARLSDTSANWRHIYKALAVIEYLIANGSERAINNIVEQSHQISSLSGFEYVESNGKDVGVNVRKKVETILGLLGDKEKLQAVRKKADATRDKYFGLSSSGITYKSSSASSSGSNFQRSDNYGTTSNTREGESFQDSFRDGKQSLGNTDGLSKSKEFVSKEKHGRKLKEGAVHVSSKQKSSTMSLNKPGLTSAANPKTPTGSIDDEFDDFDPRGSTTVGSTTINTPQVDFFRQSLVGDLLDAPISMPTETPTSNAPEMPDVDLFADAAFVSAEPNKEINDPLQENFNLFANQTVFPTPSSNEDPTFFPKTTLNSTPTNVSAFDPFAASDAVFPSESNVTSTNSINSNTFDPFAAIPLSNADASDDLFGSFASNTEPASTQSLKGDLSDSKKPSVTAALPATKKGSFQVKSGIWADSLSRGLIDLNITAPNKTDLSDIGIVGGLNDDSNEKPKAPLPSAYMGRAMGAGSGLGRPGFSSSSTTGGNESFSAFHL